MLHERRSVFPQLPLRASQQAASGAHSADPGKRTAVAGRTGLELIDASIDFCTLGLAGRRSVSCLAARRRS